MSKHAHRSGKVLVLIVGIIALVGLAVFFWYVMDTRGQAAEYNRILNDHFNTGDYKTAVAQFEELHATASGEIKEETTNRLVEAYLFLADAPETSSDDSGRYIEKARALDPDVELTDTQRKYLELWQKKQEGEAGANAAPVDARSLVSAEAEAGHPARPGQDDPNRPKRSRATAGFM